MSFYINYALLEAQRLYKQSLKYADPRVETWPLMQSPLPTMSLICMYLLMVFFGPKFMESRKPFNFKYALVIHNILVMFLNLYIGLELLYCSLKRGYTWDCQLVDTSDDPHEYRIACALWWYYFSKFIEFLDTFFFILRKKNNQLSFLHVYHHSTMFGLWWIGVKWVPGGSSVPGALLNAFVHVLMYLYYGLSAFGPTFQRYLWWKRHLTIIQLTQFTAALIAGIYAIVTDCKFPLWMQYALVIYMCSFLVLFANFYRKAYNVKSEKYPKNRSKKLNEHHKNGFIDSSIRQRNGYACHN